MGPTSLLQKESQQEVVCDRQVVTETSYGKVSSYSNCSGLENAKLVSSVNEIEYQNTDPETSTKLAYSTSNTGGETPAVQENGSSCLSGVENIERQYQHQGISDDAVKVIMSSWRDSTKKQYKVYIDKWIAFTQGKSVNISKPNISIVLEFLYSLFKAGMSYSSINTACSALSVFIQTHDHVSLGKQPLVKRFLKDVFNLRPTKTKYSSIWDVSIVLRFLKGLYPLSEINLKMLTLKTVMLMALLSSQRAQTLQLLDIRNMVIHLNYIEFQITELIKQSRPGFSLKPLEFKPYVVDKSICVVECLTEYLKRTKALRDKATQLFIAFQKPHKPVSVATISRWLKTVLKLSGIDCSIFSGHSTRSASSSAAFAAGCPIDIIMTKAGWSSAETFAAHYQKPILNVSMYNEFLLKTSLN